MAVCTLAFGLTACGGSGDDDDTTTDYRLRRKVVGAWVIECVKKTERRTHASEDKKPLPNSFHKWDVGTQLAFNSNGTYEDSKNGGFHKWDVVDEDEMELDGQEGFRYDGDEERATVEYTDEEYTYIWCWVKLRDLPVEPDPDPDPTPQPSTKDYGYRIKTIWRHYATKWSQGNGSGYLYEFSYDSQNRVSKYTYRYVNANSGTTDNAGRDDHVVIVAPGSSGYGYSYAYSNNRIDVTPVASYEKQGFCNLGRNGLAESYEGTYFTRHYYDSQNRPKSIDGAFEVTWTYRTLDTYSVKVGSGYATSAREYSFFLSKEKNDMNLNLNYFIYNIFSGNDMLREVVNALMPLGYLGRDEYLLSSLQGPYNSNSSVESVKRDSKNLITEIVVYDDGSGYDDKASTMYLDIEYEQYEK